MLKDIVEVRPLEAHRLWLRFEDGVEGAVGLDELVEFRGVFGAVKAPKVFRQVSSSAEFGTICWPNGADLDPDVLYAAVTGQPISPGGVSA